MGVQAVRCPPPRCPLSKGEWPGQGGGVVPPPTPLPWCGRGREGLSPPQRRTKTSCGPVSKPLRMGATGGFIAAVWERVAEAGRGCSPSSIQSTLCGWKIPLAMPLERRGATGTYPARSAVWMSRGSNPGLCAHERARGGRMLGGRWSAGLEGAARPARGHPPPRRW